MAYICRLVGEILQALIKIEVTNDEYYLIAIVALISMLHPVLIVLKFNSK